MDPLSQAVVGAIVPMNVSTKAKLRLAALCGMVGGLVPDLDIYIKSETDPLLYLEYHRHFTHALLSIPFLGVFFGAFLWVLLSREKYLLKSYILFTTLGVATHGLLDTCTSYGTYLLWPFSDERLTWNNMPIIDPLFTLPLLMLILFSVFYKSRKIIHISLLYGFIYLGFSAFNMLTVKDIVYEKAVERGHHIERLFVNPTIGNIILWRSIYEFEGVYYVDAVHSVPFLQSFFIEGDSVKRIDPHTIYPELGKDTQQRKDILRFNHFAMGYVYELSPYKLSDLRYGALPQSVGAWWGIELNSENTDKHVKFFNPPRDLESFYQLKNMIFKYQ